MKLIFSSQNARRPAGQLRSKGEKRSVHACPEGITTKTPAASLFAVKQVDISISQATEQLLKTQNDKGFWVFNLEADATIPSEYIILQRFLGRELAPELKRHFSNYLQSRQLKDGGWPLYEGGISNISATVKAYFALKLLGNSSNAPHMSRARRLVLNLGGAAKVNVFTRITLALFGQIPWRTIPAMPAEIMLLPRWFFFHLHKVSYWSRTVIVPLLILYGKRAVCQLKPEEEISELFLDSPQRVQHLDRFVPWNLRKNFFILLDRFLKRVDRFMPQSLRTRAIRTAEAWTIGHMQGEGGLGAIFPAMANAVMALKVLGYPDDNPHLVRGINALEDLLLSSGDEAFCQPCRSHIWDSCLSLSALLEAGLASEHKAVATSADWLFKQQIVVPGDWAYSAKDLEPGGWAFQFENSFYPDMDDTPMVLMALLRAGTQNKQEYKERIDKAVNWVLGMQNSDGGWGAFDINNNCLYLNDIPFADHGALLDPSTSDVTGRCIELLAMLGYSKNFPPIIRALTFLRKEQEECGAWYGRWGVNYIYGTWSVLMGLRQAGEDMSMPYVHKAVEWLKSCQNPDKGWGETCFSYNDPSLAGKGPSTASQTAWALLALMAAGEANSFAVQGGIHYLLRTQNTRGGWHEKSYTGTGFPRVFYLRYHGYSQYFPLWALGVYRRIRAEKKMLEDKVRLENQEA